MSETLWVREIGFGPVTAEVAQARHERLMIADPNHDDSGCFCCCTRCEYEIYPGEAEREDT